jgi:hypothetical protein
MLKTKESGALFLVLGAFGLYWGYGYLNTATPLPTDSVSCKAICGLSILAAQFFGEHYGRLATGFLWATFGLFFVLLGYNNLRK